MRHISKIEFDHLVVTGDISDGSLLSKHLRMLSKSIDQDIWFVLGNHDFYGRYMSDVCNEIRDVTEDYQNLHWLTESEPLKISNDSYLIGVDGWFDCTAGSDLILHYALDSVLIKDFRSVDVTWKKIEEFKRLAKLSALQFSEKFQKCKDAKKIVLATHVPPWVSEYGLNDEMNNHMKSYNTNCVLGAQIEDIAKANKDKEFLIISGHTHKKYESYPLKNIHNIVSDAWYFGCKVEERILVL